MCTVWLNYPKRTHRYFKWLLALLLSSWEIQTPEHMLGNY